MAVRVPALVLGVLIAGVLVGSGLAGLAHFPPNDPCSNFGSLPEGSLSSGYVDWWPLGLRCEYYVSSRFVRSTSRDFAGR